MRRMRTSLVAGAVLAALIAGSAMAEAEPPADSTASPRPPGAWLEASPPANWNRAGAPVPRALRPQGDDNLARCAVFARRPAGAEDRAVLAAGWKLWGPLQNFSGTTLVSAVTAMDGMCRPLGLQYFVFVRGRFAGTLSPAPMDARADGAVDHVFLYQSDRITADFRRYKESDPLCCPSGSGHAAYRIEDERGRPLVVPVEASSQFTEPTRQP